MPFRYCAALVATAFATISAIGTASAQAPVMSTVTSQALVSVYRNNIDHTGYTPDTMTMPLSLLWRHSTINVPGNPGSPVLSGNAVYCCAGPKVYSIRSTDGATRWAFPAGAIPVSTPATAAGYGRYGRGRFNRGGGNVPAAPNIPYFENTPTLDGDDIYLGGDDAKIYKLNAHTGTQEWAKDVGGAVRSSPVVLDGVVYFGCADGSLYALKAGTGDVLWTSSVGGSITTSPIVDSNQVLFAADDDNIYSLNASTGQLEWSTSLPGNPTASPPILAEGYVVGGSDDTLYAVNERNGVQRWHVRLDAEITTPPTYGNGVFYVGDQEGTIYAITDRGHILWQKKLDCICYGTPLLTKNALVIPAEHGALYALDVNAGGKIVWEYVLQSEANPSTAQNTITGSAAPIWAGNTLYVTGSDGTINAFTPNAPDHAGPEATGLSPRPNSVYAGIRVPYGAVLVDTGSGIDPSTVTLSVDGSPISLARYRAKYNGAAVDFSEDPNNGMTGQLTDGTHEVTLVAADWRGNKLTTKWRFTVDNRLNPKAVPVPDAATPPPAEADNNPTPTQPADNGGPAMGGGSPQPVLGADNGGGGNNTDGGGGQRTPPASAGGVNGGPPPPPPLPGAPGAPAPPPAP